MRCEAMHREARGQPWEQCNSEATHVLVHRSNIKAYCQDDAERFIATFPDNTFKLIRMVKDVQVQG